MTDTITYTFDMDAEMHSELKEIAESEQRTLAGQIRLIIQQWLEKQK